MQRIQRKRTKGWKMPANTIYVGRPTRWGNPWTPTKTKIWTPDVITLEECLQKYKRWLDTQIRVYGNDFLEPLKGKDLACWCPLNQPCHADILLKALD